MKLFNSARMSIKIVWVWVGFPEIGRVCVCAGGGGGGVISRQFFLKKLSNSARKSIKKFGLKIYPKLTNNWGPLSSTFHVGRPRDADRMEIRKYYGSWRLYEDYGVYMRIVAVIWGSWRLYEDHGGYIEDHNGYMRIMTVICSGVGARDTCVSTKIQTII